MERVNLKNFDFDGFGAALAPTELNRTEQLKLFAAVFNHNARKLEDLKRAPQVRAATRDWVQTNGELPQLKVVERRQADDGFVKYLFESPLGGRFEAVRIPLFDTKYVV